MINRWDLDQVVEVAGKKVNLSQYPIYLVQLSGHYASSNSLALIKARIMDESGRFYSGKDKECVTVPNKTVEEAFNPVRSAFGSFFHVSSHKGSNQIDGMIYHHYAMEELIGRGIKFAGFPRLDEKELNIALKQRCREFIQKGVTSIYDNNLRALSLFDAVKEFPKKG